MNQKKKICLIGAYGVGKTSLVARFVHAIFSDDYHSTLGVKVDKKPVEVEGQSVTLMIWDTAGEDRFEVLNMANLMGASGYLLVVDGTRGGTFRQARATYERIQETVPGLPCLVLINKADRKHAWAFGDAETAELEELGLPWTETSARTGSGVEDAFLEIARRAMHFDAAAKNPVVPHAPPDPTQRFRFLRGTRLADAWPGRLLEAVLQLPRERMARRLMADVLSAHEVMVLERHRDGRYRTSSDCPPWFRQLFPERKVRLRRPVDPVELFPSLEAFLPAADVHWEEGPPGEPMESEFWGEDLPDGGHLHLVASALGLNRRRLLVIRPIERQFARMQATLQHFRDVNLGQEQLLHEMSKKEILIHCLVHDLSSPVMGIQTLVEFLRVDGKLEPDVIEVVDATAHSFSYLQKLIRAILKVFAAEIRDLERFETNVASAPDLLAVCDTEMARMEFAFRSNDVTLKRDFPDDGREPIPVVGEPEKLGRMLANLMENALRFAPRQSTVTVRVRPVDADVVVEVIDEGPGVAAEVIDSMFDILGRKAERGGKIGLGLYFVRMMAERWGGTADCERGRQGGACVWFRLPKPSLTTPD